MLKKELQSRFPDPNYYIPENDIILGKTTPVKSQLYRQEKMAFTKKQGHQLLQSQK